MPLLQAPSTPIAAIATAFALIMLASASSSTFAAQALAAPPAQALAAPPAQAIAGKSPQAIAGKSPQAIIVKAKPFDFTYPSSADDTTLWLEWRGGLVLESPEASFGGFSGLSLDATGTELIAVSDRGTLWTAHLIYDRGHLNDITESRMHPLPLRRDGTILPKWRRDAEALAIDYEDTTLYIAFEGDHKILRFAMTANGHLGPSEKMPLAPELPLLLDGNQGLEALALTTYKDRLAFIAVGEDIGQGWLVDAASGDILEDLAIIRQPPYKITDIAVAPDGNLFLLERHFSLIGGFRVRLRRLPSLKAEITERRGTLLPLGRNGYGFDNMEGIALHRDKDGTLIITLISDDNFNPFQQTLLLQFALRGDLSNRQE